MRLIQAKRSGGGEREECSRLRNHHEIRKIFVRGFSRLESSVGFEWRAGYNEGEAWGGSRGPIQGLGL